MLNIQTTQSKNYVNIAGILSTLDIEEKTTSDNRDYVIGKASIKVDQEINGKMVQCEPTIRFFSMRLTKNGEQNKLYDRILGYRNQFTSLAACPENQPELASKVEVTSAELGENIWIDSTGKPQSTFQINGKFMREARNPSEFEHKATFELSGVVVNMARETVNDEETGRLKIKFAVVGYNGKVNLIELIAESDNAVNFIETNWAEGDTVNVNGYINMSQHTKVWYEQQGFGPDIKRTKTETRRELIIVGGSPSGLDEEYSYSAEDIKLGLQERQQEVEKQKSRVSSSTKSSTPKRGNQFGF